MDRTAAFGPRIPEEGIILNLIAVETLEGSDQSACQRVYGAPRHLDWVALVERGGDCSFVDKVRNMQASGAKAVIVGDNQRSGLITMYAGGKSLSLFSQIGEKAGCFLCLSCVSAAGKKRY